MNDNIPTVPNSTAADAARTNSQSSQLTSEWLHLPLNKPERDSLDFVGARELDPFPIEDGLATLGPIKPRFVCSIATAKASHAWRERKRKRRRHAENRRIVLAIKAMGCWLCGDTTCEIYDLHFHHLGDKKGCIARLLTRSTEALRDELLGTRLICRRCHSEHHEVLDSKAWKTGGCYEV